MDNSEKLSLIRLLARLNRMSDETKAEFGVITTYYTADKEAVEIRKEMNEWRTERMSSAKQLS